MEELLTVLRKFPLLVPQNDHFTVFDGYISAGKKEFLISLKVPSYPLLEDLRINLPWHVELCLGNSGQEVKNWEGNCTSLLTFLECLQSEIEESLKSDFAKLLFRSGDRMPVEFYEKLVDSIGCLEVKNILRKLETVKDKSLADLFNAFEETVLALSDFWDVVDEMDQKCWVILPEQPKWSDTFRRIALGQHVSLVVTLDPSCIQKVPELNFFGPEQVVKHLVSTMQENIARWPERQSFVDSLQILLGIDVFPSNPEEESSSSTADMECMICCSVLLAGETPMEACTNRCGAVYHTSCISQWLVVIASGSDSSGTIQGKCPSCNVGILRVSNVKQ
ncbi:hypothetical protein PR048_014264 [Dryococelus australis]|uniref:RING-type domain-containing protein n=1 Tax=Dryococelus australis TaxID=614101 RepID=A0ABQ9HE52_9NEOP|nr:hypothetical protein PR048_014264 [Dryococelus australis]